MYPQRSLAWESAVTLVALAIHNIIQFDASYAPSVKLTKKEEKHEPKKCQNICYDIRTDLILSTFTYIIPVSQNYMSCIPKITRYLKIVDHRTHLSILGLIILGLIVLGLIILGLIILGLIVLGLTILWTIVLGIVFLGFCIPGINILGLRIQGLRILCMD